MQVVLFGGGGGWCRWRWMVGIPDVVVDWTPLPPPPTHAAHTSHATARMYLEGLAIPFPSNATKPYTYAQACVRKQKTICSMHLEGRARDEEAEVRLEPAHGLGERRLLVLDAVRLCVHVCWGCGSGVSR